MSSGYAPLKDNQNDSNAWQPVGSPAELILQFGNNLTSIETRLSKLETKSSADTPIFFWAMNGCRPMTDREVEKGIAALNPPTNARITPVSWLGDCE
jgi:hypothetical protein